MSSIRDELQKYPRIELTRMPTPLHRLDHLSQNLGVNFYLKRDDLTDLTLGGDKARKLEYEIARAQQNGADTLVTCGSSQSNHARLTTAAARKVGMECVVVLSHDDWESNQGNLLMVHLLGAGVLLVEVEDHWVLEKYALEACAELESQGKKPHYIPVSGSTPHSCLGYVRAGLEIIDQLEDQGVQLDAIYTPFGTGGIFTSILFTLRALSMDVKVIGISVNRRREECLENIDQWWGALRELLGQNTDQEPDNFEVTDEFLGKEYGDPTQACLHAITTMAQTEGILLDPVYSGKVFSGFLEHQNQGRWGADDNILMVHSGGVPALFAYHQAVESYLTDQGMMTPFRLGEKH